jgi:putative tryptophan/tyrosine transport system substrate-binding protein
LAENQNERLPALAVDLVNRPVTLIVATTTVATLAAKAATTTIPIVFEMGGDPIRFGVVASLSQPGGNITGVTQLSVVVARKRLELLHELIPTAKAIGLMADPTDPVSEKMTGDLQAVASTLALKLHVLDVSGARDFAPAFDKLTQLRIGGLVLGAGALFSGNSEQIAELALHHAVPAVFEGREFVAAGGLMSYGGSLTGLRRPYC